ncbi:alkene reductase [Glycomyces harbinensis]|uniref:N-ethylmaleimide reductase n=1 Tax=Glycomyces harbinensis TaxID=58114 RepID=A0A1G6VUA8_9ACTN|nr:alkene reductase [Glycomyces harbinensis]SDD56577.1 N-ethylmaleimide reductase [Glycomyces harbinensis]
MTHSAEADSLFAPARVGSLELPNRLVMAPMTRNRAEDDGTPPPLMAEYYAQRASAGLIVTEAAIPAQVGITTPNVAGIYTESQVAGWRGIAEAVHAAGGRIFMQIEHGGRVGHRDNSGLDPIAPSPIALPEGIHTPSGRQDSPVPIEMTAEDIRTAVAQFAAAARNGVRAGFSGVEVHAANGYLLHQFLADGTNRRTDGYGGSVANRIRFVVEVVRAVADAVGAERVGIRISPGNRVNGISESDTDVLYPALIDAIAPLGMAYVHTVYTEPDAPWFTALRRQWKGTLIANPVLGRTLPIPEDGGLSKARRLIEAGADLVSLGRAFLANPDLVERLRIGAPLNPVREEGLEYTGGPDGYTDYPTLAASEASPSRSASAASTLGSALR